MPLYLLSGAPPQSEWVKPADWLPLPTVTAADQKFVGLFAVFDTDSNFVALTATGDYTVDWGDGSATENIATGVQAEHKYTYASISNATLSTRGYKQVIITVIPNGGSLLSVNIDKRHSTASAQIQRVPWLDITCSCDPASTLGFSSAGTMSASSFLERATILNGSARTSFAAMFNDCHSLQSIPLFNTSAGTNFSTMFQNCYSLKSLPLINTSLGTLFNSMLSSCLSLESMPLLNTMSGTNFSLMFTNCRSLQSIPLLNVSSGITFTSMFNTCYSLQALPALNMVSGTTFTTIFTNCLSIAKSLVINLSITHSYLNCNLSATALDEIYTNLPVVVGQTITITGNYGAAGSTQTIATGKGWTVVN